ncbi:tail assembly chaperone [Thomasclavelia spiroformis]|uniref:tail assembly chaperone n=1 Tax=Thomasclavelia spiroformis TaxID=29348 RepID=UPI002432A237|nr:tail assembly chaperone [Thomasclavelia spiroformis]
MELTINGKVYQFKASIAFMRLANNLVEEKVDNTNLAQKVGLRYLIAGLIDGDVEQLINALDFMNTGFDQRLTRKEIEDFIEDENVDVDGIFEMVLDFLSKANVSKRTYNALMEQVNREKARIKAMMKA